MRTLILTPILVFSSLCFGQEGPCNNATSLSYQGYDYDIVEIGDQCWFAENLRNEHYENGDTIVNDLLSDDWMGTTSGASTVFGEGDSPCYDYSPDGDGCDEIWSLNEYGRLYNWYAVNDPRNLCISGWHVPSIQEWETMINFLGGVDVAGEKMKTTYGWYQGGNGTNTSGFSGLPGGVGVAAYSGSGDEGRFWSSSPFNGEALSVQTSYFHDNVTNFGYSNELNTGLSVRCVNNQLIVSTPGCTYPQACNYNPESNFDDGSCDYCFCLEGTQWSDSLQGCVSTAPPLMDACGAGTYWDEDAQTCLTTVTCAEDLNTDGIVGIADLLQLLSMFGTPCDEVETSEFSCGDPMNYHGYDYETVLIGEQCWFAENLRTEHYTNGDAIPANLSDGEWSATTSGAVAVYGESTDCANSSPDGNACDPIWSLSEYGRLYNWYAVDDVRGLCPTGWHVPTQGEQVVITDFLGGESVAGVEMKNTFGWYGGSNGNNSSGFSVCPSGYRYYGLGSFISAGYSSNFWSSTANSSSWAYGMRIDIDSTVSTYGASHKRTGNPVRCVRD